MMKGYCLCFLIVFLFTACHQSDKKELLSASSGENVEAFGWEKEYWSNQENYTHFPSGKNKSEVLAIESDSMTVNRWVKKVAVKPYANYKVSGYIKTENVEGETRKAGAGFRFGTLKNEQTIFSGNTDWTYVETMLQTEGNDSFLMECVLGINGKAKGKVYFDNIHLEFIDQEVLAPKVAINFQKTKEPMSPYLYGQFIEHMGKCIYGGIWAEMLVDRKFYHRPGTADSPWKVNRDTTEIKLDGSKEFSKAAVPGFTLAEKDLELSQDSVSVEKSKEYQGRIVYKASAGIKQLKVAFISKENVQQEVFDIHPNTYFKQDFSFSTGKDDENARIEFTFTGKGSVTLAAVSLMPNDNIRGFRKDVITLMKKLNAPVYRWPGGNFVSGYDWKDGIGDRDTRPTRYERAWNGLEYNDVGVHEFMDLCEILNAEANVAVNTGLGNADMAADEVAYFNGTTDTEMGQWRAQNGHPEPYNVKLWAVGNEMFGDWQLGHMPVEDYVKKHNKVAQAMQEVDSTISLIAVGFPGNWNKMMYENCLEEMTYISEHFYRQDWHAGGLMTHVKQIPDAIREVADEHRKWRKKMPGLEKKEVKIALDEWNYWYGPHVYGLLGTRYFLRDALGIAAGINEFSRQSDLFFMANYAQTVNVIGAIKTTKTDAWLEGTGLVLQLYNEKFGSIPVTLSGNPKPLDVAATLTNDKKYLTLSVINATHQPYPLSIDFIQENIASSGVRYTISGANDMVYNDEKNKEQIAIKEEQFIFEGQQLQVPKESANIYVFKIH